MGEPRLVTAAMTGMAHGLALLARPLAPWMPVTGLIFGAAGIGVLIPALAVRISSPAGPRQGWALGRQSSAASLGQAIRRPAYFKSPIDASAWNQSMQSPGGRDGNHQQARAIDAYNRPSRQAYGCSRGPEREKSASR